MLYSNQGIYKKSFAINQIDVKDGKIHQIYHHRVNCVKYPNQSPEYVAVIVEKDLNHQLYLQLYEIVSTDNTQKNE